MLNLRKQLKEAQVTIEFTFCMIVVFIMIYSTVKIFIWSGVDLAERRIAHEEKIFEWVGAGRNYQAGNLPSLRASPLKQIDPLFHSPEKMNAVWETN